jgi:hypothetical protein
MSIRQSINSLQGTVAAEISACASDSVSRGRRQHPCAVTRARHRSKGAPDRRAALLWPRPSIARFASCCCGVSR